MKLLFLSSGKAAPSSRFRAMQFVPYLPAADYRRTQSLYLFIPIACWTWFLHGCLAGEMLPGELREFTIASGGNVPILTIECDRLVKSQSIGFEADLK